MGKRSIKRLGFRLCSLKLQNLKVVKRSCNQEVSCTINVPLILPVSSRYLVLHLGSGAISGKMLLVRIVEDNKIDAYFRAG